MSLFTSFGGGDIWSGNGFAFASPIDDILERNQFTLGELLEEDEILQEVKSVNPKLINFLCRSEILSQLLSYMIEPIPDKSSDSRRFKYPYMSCEILCCEVPVLLDVLTSESSPQHLNKLFSLLNQKPNTLDNHQAGYFEKVFMVLLKHRCAPVVSYVNTAGMPLFSKLTQHMSDFSVMQVARRLLLPKYSYLQDDAAGACQMAQDDEETDGTNNAAILWCNWSDNIEVINILMKGFTVSKDEEQTEEQQDTASHQAELCLSLITLCGSESVFLNGMYNSHVLETLTNAVSSQSSTSTSTLPSETCETSLAALRIFEALLYRIAPQIHHEHDDINHDNNTINQQQKDTENTAENSDQNDKTVSNDNDNDIYSDTGIPHVDHDVMVKCIETLLANMCIHLQYDYGSVTTSTRSTIQRVSAIRLQIIRVIQVLIQVDWPEIDVLLVDCNAINTMIDMFFKHEHCSLLHQIVSIALIRAFDSDSAHTLSTTDERKALQKHIISECKLLERIREAVACNSVNEAQGVNRRGYMGHIILLSEGLLKAQEYHDDTDDENEDIVTSKTQLQQQDDATDANNPNSTDNKNADDESKIEVVDNYISSLIKADDCAVWWYGFVSTTLTEALLLQNTPLGNFAIPTRDNEQSLDIDSNTNGIDDMLLKVDDTMIDHDISLNSQHASSSGTVLDGTIGSMNSSNNNMYANTLHDDMDNDLDYDNDNEDHHDMISSMQQHQFEHDTDDIDPSIAISAWNNNTDHSNHHESHQDFDNTGWANFAEFNDPQTSTATSHSDQGFADFEAAFGNSSSSQQQQQHDATDNNSGFSGFEANFADFSSMNSNDTSSSFMSPPNERAPQVTDHHHDGNVDDDVKH